MSHKKVGQRRTIARRRSWLGAIALAAVMLAAACGGASPPGKGGGGGGGSAGLQMWVAGNNVTKPIYTAETKSYSKADISLTDLPGPAYTQKLDAALAAGKPPSIYQLFGPGPQMNTLLKGHKLATLDDLVQDPSYRSRFVPAALAQGKVNGHQYGIPYNIFQESVVIYSKKAFKKAGISAPPKTWSQLMDDVKKLKKAGVIPVSISGTSSDNWYEWWLEDYEVHLAGLGVTQAVKQGNLKALNSKPVVDAATAMQELVKADAFEPGYTTTSEANNVPYALLGTGKAGMLLYGAFTPNFVGLSTPDFVKKGDMGWFSFPSVEGGTGNDILDLASTPMLVVNNNMSKSDVKAAKDFLKWFIYSSDQVSALAKSGNVGPAAKAAPLVQKSAPSYLKDYMEFQLTQALHSQKSFVHWSTLMPTDKTSSWNELLEELFSLKITPQQFAQKAAGM